MNLKATKTSLNPHLQKKKAVVLPREEGGKVEMAMKSQFTLRLWGLRNRFNSILTMSIALIIVLTIFITMRNGDQTEILAMEAKELSAGSCDLFSGRWVYDNTTYPLYQESGCKFMSDQSACEKFGRRDLKYQNWRWQPHGCNLPRWGSFEDQHGIHKEIDSLRGYELALNTWSEWLEFHVDHLKTKLFFMSMSPTHLSPSGQNCYDEAEPIAEEGYWGEDTNENMMRVVEKVIKSLRGRGVSVQMLNITQLSEYRKDGHPSIYRKQWEPLTKEQQDNPGSYADCIHWCLPGVPDVWNQLLYAYLFPE
ncbi:hypothetical protein B296_00002484 [Ensete ventricosum]|uniref:Trichome birefringence-like C-terminal domain-containing protein n=1 Tax=Ensete ventricosum TaxID=4639 RepID=A0A427A060_ENSVE|nr:hypothetical protein B296_00002484 [Ensete ventricosum]